MCVENVFLPFVTTFLLSGFVTLVKTKKNENFQFEVEKSWHQQSGKMEEVCQTKAQHGRLKKDYKIDLTSTTMTNATCYD